MEQPLNPSGNQMNFNYCCEQRLNNPNHQDNQMRLKFLNRILNGCGVGFVVIFGGAALFIISSLSIAEAFVWLLLGVVISLLVYMVYLVCIWQKNKLITDWHYIIADNNLKIIRKRNTQTKVFRFCIDDILVLKKKDTQNYTNFRGQCKAVFVALHDPNESDISLILVKSDSKIVLIQAKFNQVMFITLKRSLDLKTLVC